MNGRPSNEMSEIISESRGGNNGYTERDFKTPP